MASDPIHSQEWRRLRVQAYRRDMQAGAPCAICRGERGPIRYDLRPSSAPLAYEPDHIRSRADHPELALCIDNIQASHRVCNQAKGRRAAVNGMGSPTRDW